MIIIIIIIIGIKYMRPLCVNVGKTIKNKLIKYFLCVDNIFLLIVNRLRAIKLLYVINVRAFFLQKKILMVNVINLAMVFMVISLVGKITQFFGCLLVDN
jgi:hypothetical protein